MKTCAALDCKDEALWEPVILLFPEKGGPAEIHIELPHCAGCKLKAKLEHIMSALQFEDLVKLAMRKGLPRPVREKTTLTFKALVARH